MIAGRKSKLTKVRKNSLKMNGKKVFSNSDRIVSLKTAKSNYYKDLKATP